MVFHLAAAQHEANVPDQEILGCKRDWDQNILDACVNARIKGLSMAVPLVYMEIKMKKSLRKQYAYLKTFMVLPNLKVRI